MDFQLLINAAKQKTGIQTALSICRSRECRSSTSYCRWTDLYGDLYRYQLFHGFCAEQAAAAQMITDGQQRVLQMVAINSAGEPIPPFVAVAVNSSAS